MQDKELVQLVVSEADSATDSSVTVRTDGGSREVGDDLPLVALNWSSFRATDDESHSNFDKRIFDDSGNEIGTRYVFKYNMELDFTVKSDDEMKRDEIGEALQLHFAMYEGNTEALHSDTYMVKTGDIRPRKIPIKEPDWYQNGLIVNIRYNKYVSDTGSLETIKSVDKTINVQEELNI